MEQPIADLIETHKGMTTKNVLEAFHDAQQALDSALNLFSLGYLPLAQRSMAENFYWSICRRIQRLVAEMDEKRVELTTSLASTDQFTIQPPPEPPTKQPVNKDMPTLTQMMKKMDMESALHTGKMATRRAYGIALRAVGQCNDRVVSLDAQSRRWFPIAYLLGCALIIFFGRGPEVFSIPL